MSGTILKLFSLRKEICQKTHQALQFTHAPLFMPRKPEVCKLTSKYWLNVIRFFFSGWKSDTRNMEAAALRKWPFTQFSLNLSHAVFYEASTFVAIVTASFGNAVTSFTEVTCCKLRWTKGVKSEGRGDWQLWPPIDESSWVPWDLAVFSQGSKYRGNLPEEAGSEPRVFGGWVFPKALESLCFLKQCYVPINGGMVTLTTNKERPWNACFNAHIQVSRP